MVSQNLKPEAFRDMDVDKYPWIVRAENFQPLRKIAQASNLGPVHARNATYFVDHQGRTMYVAGVAYVVVVSVEPTGLYRTVDREVD